MQKLETIDFSKLFGFQTVSEGIDEGPDFRDETVGAKLGAKVGLEADAPNLDPR